MALVLSLVAGCKPARPPEQKTLDTIADVERGRQLVGRYGCTACHVVPGVPGGDASHGTIGPPLASWAGRTLIAGLLPNTPDQLALWLRAPQTIKPGDAMPDLGVGEREARDMAAFLFTRQ